MKLNKIEPRFKKISNPRIGLIALATDFMIEKDFINVIKDKEIAEALELPAIKLHCSVLAEEGIKRAIENWEEKVSHRKHNNPPELT